MTVILLICLTLPAMAEWQEIETTLGQSVWASSTFCETLGGQQVCYGPENVFDGNPGTCWVEAAEGDGAGERLTFIVAFTAPGLVTELDYYLYLAQELESAEQELEDTPAPQLVAGAGKGEKMPFYCGKRIQVIHLRLSGLSR